jgi:sugar-phosphatase
MTNIKKYHAGVLLFDMDGTLVDSTPVVERTWRRFAERHGLDGNRILSESHGRRTAETVTMFAPPHLDIEKETAQLVAEEMADVEGITAVAGATSILNALPQNRWAVVTSANRELALRRMNAAGLPIPDVLIAAEDVRQGKPSPEGYLAAARALNASPDVCLVFEDAPAGLAAGNAARMRVFTVGPALRTTEMQREHWMLDFTFLQISVPDTDHEPIVLVPTN